MITLYPYQEKVSPLLFNYLRVEPDGHPCVAIPTGGGKTYILADVIERTLAQWPDTKILVLSHVKEILQQDYNSLVKFTGREIGLYSSGLNSRTIKQVTVAGIQSAYRSPNLFQQFGFVIIDEAHLIPPSGEGMYRTFLKDIGHAKYFGLTATPFRLGSGYIYGQEDSLFTDLIYDLTTLESFNKLIEDGYLCNLKVKHTELEFVTDGLHRRAGDFIDKELSARFDKDFITEQAVQEIIRMGKDYKKWLLFAIDIEHAEHITEQLLQNGVNAYIVHSKMSDAARDNIIQRFKDGHLRALVNVNILTTGFDSPDIDLIGMLRPTMSPVFHVQSIGRGLRTAPGKDHCLVLDFAGNTERLGPINAISVRKKQNKKDGNGEPITKRCPQCDFIHHPAAKFCDNCGHKFEFQTRLTSIAGNVEVVAKTGATWYKVTDISYKVHKKKNSPKSVKVIYFCGLRRFAEWVCVEHNGFAGAKAKKWLERRGWEIDETFTNSNSVVVNHSKLRTPARIHVNETGKYPDIIEYDFADER